MKANADETARRLRPSSLLAGLFSMLFGQRIAKTVASMTAAMRQLGEGRFDVVLPGLGRKDELGDMAEAVIRPQAQRYRPYAGSKQP
ncbi:hypothetical protein XH81_04485 [Bradyrhizobium sp. CCBAU 25360]|nr:hypothetical protein [Bradyrhizobium sp. CCBAU 25360]